MKTSQELRDAKAAKFEQAQRLIDTARAAGRDLTAEETTQYDQLIREIDDLEPQIARAEKHERLSGQAASRTQPLAAGSATQEEKAKRNYSMIRAIAGHMNNKLDGLEREMHDEAVREAGQNGHTVQGLGVPGLVLGAGQGTRDMTATGQTTSLGDQGGTTIATDLSGDFVGLLYAAMALRGLGTRYLTGLVGNLDFATLLTGTNAVWGTENGDLTESSPTTGKFSLSPHRLGTFVDLSKQALIQSSFGLEQMVREDMIMGIALAVEIAAINGSGSNSQPLGLLNAGIADISATNGAAPDWAAVVGLETKVDTVNALLGSLGYLTNTKVRGVLKQTAKMGNTIAQPIWGEGGNPLNGYQAAVTNNVPSNLSQGTGTNLSPLIFGNFRDLLIGQWGGLDITADPYTKAKQGQIVLTVDSFWDVALRRKASFAKTKVVAG
ncbi:hypothetical protein GCM10027594_18770 [Hymenobacter agri]